MSSPRDEKKQETVVSVAKVPTLFALTTEKLLEREGGCLKLIEYLRQFDANKANTVSLREPLQALLLKNLLKNIVEKKFNEEVKAILEYDPTLIFMVGEVQNHLGETVKGSAHSIGIATANIPLLNCIRPLIEKVENGVSKALQEVKEQYPQGHPIDYSSYSFRPLINAIYRDARIDAYEMSDETAALLNDFRTAVKERRPCFRGVNLIKALVMACFQVNRHTRWEWAQQYFFCTKVIGFLQKYLPAHAALAVRHGLVEFDGNPKFYYDNISAYFKDSKSFIGEIGEKHVVSNYGIPRVEINFMQENIIKSDFSAQPYETLYEEQKSGLLKHFHYLQALELSLSNSADTSVCAIL